MNKYIVVLGNFDGVHIAHQELIKNAILIAKELSLKPLLVCFNPHTAFIIKEGHRLILTREDKINLLKSEFKIDIFEIEFNNEVAMMGYGEFIFNILLKVVDIHTLITGYNFRFGHKRLGDTKSLACISSSGKFHYICINEMMLNYIPISSSEVKRLLSMGAVGLAQKLLGRNFFISGVVCHGKKLGAKIGFKTLNIEYPENLYVPLLGVYLVLVSLNVGKFYGVANIGIRPTLHTDNSIIVEVHLLEFDLEVYEEDVKIELLQFIRPERKFGNIEELIYQINMDVSAASFILKNTCYATEIANNV
ncbi:Riboflavin biosynthesis protein RibF [Candidatus Cyrtobacter comes]|uniref:Riboflavin biosynthesis protein n=1 Tax=Candidatus Cyrtobacter comes TaxID=675776 RepID=A0ABU5L6Y1_9RICK|nr:riboflavin biosynthesis protein RibF [Candidatus Cyrtobacter comes]MDZ5761879.1 Riboflavin biosynthesis protein RibF [Candidatus Cyrtobacter comes]